MKFSNIAICFMLAFVGFCEAQEQSAPQSQSLGKYIVDFELGTGLGIARDCKSGNLWSPGPTAGVGVNFSYSPTKLFRVRAGVSEQSYSSSRMVEHPYPYVMDMKLKLTTIATRLTVGSEWVIPQTKKSHSSFMGIGLYGDVIHSAKARNSLSYISHTGSETLNVKGSFSTITPGIMINAGHQGPLGRIDLRYMEDLQRFDIPGIPMGKQRRSYIGLNFAHYLGSGF